MKFLHQFTSSITLLILIVSSKAEEEDGTKRAPSAFTEVRGKQFISDEAFNEVLNNKDADQQATVAPEISDNYVLEKRSPMGFFGTRGKKPSDWLGYNEEMYKRAPMGFVGMRGKKESLDYFNEPSLKRARMGFFGMRGKRYFVEPQYQEEKRAPMGFFGMRGKKDFEDSYYDNKRAPNGFFGVRGKKQPYGFFGMRGKKYPYEFRGKFVGVRGKKSQITVPKYIYEEPNVDKLISDLDYNQLMLLLTEQDESRQ
ncbi:hypothetical protein ABEB36_008899 [Hypothenemus hampei]|uniref:Tachykinin n=1 Tax=Hypothenemus hampei TaxID=57062 RepID=A0ABD1EP08_HYPHA